MKKSGMIIYLFLLLLISTDCYKEGPSSGPIFQANPPAQPANSSTPVGTLVSGNEKGATGEATPTETVECGEMCLIATFSAPTPTPSSTFAGIPSFTQTILITTPAPTQSTPMPMDVRRLQCTPTPEKKMPAPVDSTPEPTFQATLIDYAELRSGPGDQYNNIYPYLVGSDFKVVGKSENEKWIVVKLPCYQNYGVGWVPIEKFDKNINIENLPSIRNPSVPTPVRITPTQNPGVATPVTIPTTPTHHTYPTTN